MRLFLLSLSVVSLLAREARAQERPPAAWVFEVGVTSFQGGVRDTDNAVAGPDAGRILALRRTIPIGRLELGLGASYQKTAFGVRVDPDYFAGFKDEYSMLEFSPELRIPVRRHATGARLLLHAGPTVQYWRFDGSGRSSFGGSVGSTLVTAFTTRLDLQVRGEYTFAGTWANADDTSGSLSPEGTHRWRWTIGLARHRRQ